MKITRKSETRNVKYFHKTEYLSSNKSDRTKQHSRTISNTQETIANIVENNKSLRSIFSGRSLTTKKIKEIHSTKTYQKIKSTASKHWKTNVLRRNNKIKLKEIPFNVTGWPLGSSLSVEDYVDYFRITSILSPDISKDSSTFDESNDYSVLVAVGK